ncbi:MAG: type II toxin-antitoxin system YafQ family toxin [Bacteroides sp.]|nr:type II toxin-antitoxin system YafQ family toxin [Bacteroides sp.]
MYSLKYTGSFKRDYKKCVKRGLPVREIEKALNYLVEKGGLPEEYSPHKLHGNYEGKWECHLNGKNSDWLMVWEQNDTELTLLMLRTGTHSDIF